MKNIGIVIPTYNAHNSIEDTIHRIHQITSNATIVVVDDNSPDNTSTIVKKAFQKNKNVLVLNRAQKQGRGSAVIAGFKKLLQKKELDYFIEMDADLCHDPKYIPLLIKACQKVDVVIASRYLPKSRITGWNLKRKFMSRSINTMARLILQIPITDYSNGYRCYNRKAVAIICASQLKSKGFIVLSEVAYICHKNKLQFSEIPFDFNYLAISKSNLNTKEMKEAILTLLQLRLTK